MRFRTGRHASDEVLEQYSMGLLDARASEAFEEHLLICPGCQDKLAFVDAYRQGMRSAALDLRQQTSAPAQARVNSVNKQLWGLPKPAWILGMAALVLLVAGSWWPSIYRPAARPALVILESNRGAQSPTSTMPTAKPFTLMLDLTDLPVLPQYRLEIVDAAGRAVFGLSATPENHKLRATIAKGLPGGMYYVRLYGQDLLREYGLAARD